MKKRIPTTGIIGEAAMREAAASDLNDIMQLVRKAVQLALSLHNNEYLDIDSMYPDRIIYKRDGRYFSYSYTIDDNNQVQLGQREEVVKDHKAVAMREAAGEFIEATGKPNRFLIRVIRAGLSGNLVNYPSQVLREAAPLFEDCRVFAKSDDEHIAGKGKDVNKLIGKLKNVTFVEATKDQPAEIRADLVVLESSGVAAKLREALENDMTDLFGFSIDARGVSRTAGKFREAVSIKKVQSVDLIVEPGAGGELLSFIEALNEEDTDMKLRDKMIQAIKTHNPTALASLDTNDDEALESAYREALSLGNDANGKGSPAGRSGAANAGVSPEELDERFRMIEARNTARQKIAGTKLPPEAKTRLNADFDKRVSFVEADVDTAIDAEAKYLSSLTGGSFIEGLGDSSFEAGEDRADKVVKMLDGFFDPANRDVRSMRECYIEITGDRLVRGDLRSCDMQRLREATQGNFREAVDSSTFGNVLGDSIARAMLANYNLQSNLDVWKLLANVVPVNDFRTQERTRMGGYGDIPGVAESGDYTALSSPGDEKASYAVTKRGGTESITLETIKNDDVGAIQRIPTKLSRAAKRTLSKFVLNLLAANGVIYDTKALFHADHNNLQTTALSAITLAVQRLAMMSQTEADSGERLGIPPANLWVPADLEQTAVDLFNRGTENDKTFIASMSLNVVPVWYWTDVNNWFLSADKNDIPGIEVGFLDGQEEPELFVQDNPTQGSLFTNDEITYKLRHIYSGAVTDWRAFTGNIVA